MKAGSNLEKVLSAGKFAVTGELGPPRGGNASAVKEKTQYLKGMVDAVNITDNQTAVVRMASWAASVLLMKEGPGAKLPDGVPRQEPDCHAV